MTAGQVWLGKNVNFEMVHDQLQLEGFQLFAVEKWFVLFFPFSFSPFGPQYEPGSQRGQDPSSL
jgi:hypothetical protein